jgi:hypothetical protein
MCVDLEARYNVWVWMGVDVGVGLGSGFRQWV